MWQLVFWSLGLWAAFIGFMSWQREPLRITRFGVGLVLGAAFSRLGWAALHVDMVVAHPEAMLDPNAGYTILAFPLGLLVAIPWREPARKRREYLNASMASLPVAFFFARLACFATGCCHGTPTALPWSVDVRGAPSHPTPLYEAGLWIGVYLVVRKLDARWVPGIVLGATGATRLIVAPFRAPPPLGAPAIPIEALAIAWLVVAALASPLGARMYGAISEHQRSLLATRPDRISASGDRRSRSPAQR